MKHFFTFFILAVITLTSYSQTRQRFDRKVDSMLVINRQNHNYLDTLWVLDSSRTYQLVNNALMYERTFKVLSRNELGNPISSLDWADENYPYFTDNNLYDSVVYFNGTEVKKRFVNAWNSVEQSWIDNRYEEYDAPDLPKVMAYKGFSNSNQDYFYGHRERYVNNNGRLDTLIYETYIPETNSWDPRAKTAYDYAGQNSDTLQMIYKWTGDSWQDSAKLHRQFNADHLTRQLWELYNSDNGTWQNYVLYTYSYDNNGNIDTGYFQVWDIQLNIWQDNFKFVFSYDDEQRLTNRLVMHFDQNSQQLLNYQNEIFEFADGCATEIYQNWHMPDGPWQNQTRNTTSYIAEDIIDTLQFDLWNFSSQIWQPNNRTVNKFDEHINLIESEDWYYLSWDSEWQLNTKIDFYWSPFIPNAIPEIQSSALVVYPNPASTQVSFSLPNVLPSQNQNGVVQLYNLSGQKISELVLTEGSAIWDCSGVKPGLYVYVALIGDSSLTGKIVVGN